MLEFNIDHSIMQRFFYMPSKQENVVTVSIKDKAKQEVMRIERQASAKGWTKEMIWKTGAKNYLGVSLYEYLCWEGGEVFKIENNNIIILTPCNCYVYIYKKDLLKRFGDNKSGSI